MQNITRKSIAVVVFCYNHCGEIDRDRLKREKRYTIGETETLLTEKTKRRKENTVKHTQRRYIKEEIANGTICPVEITLKRLTKI